MGGGRVHISQTDKLLWNCYTSALCQALYAFTLIRFFQQPSEAGLNKPVLQKEKRKQGKSFKVT